MDDGTMFLTVTEVADMLGVPSETERSHTRERRLRALVLRAGERVTYRIRPADYEAFRRDLVRDSFQDDWE